MRIISGIHKGKRIVAPKKLPVRPTTDMAKEALFNILNNQYHFEDLSVLDLFAGTGNISFEFASRGTKDIYCIDSNAGCVRFIETISSQLELGIKVRKMDVFKFLEQTNSTFDVIFADPPYDLSVDLFSKIHQLVFENKLLNPNGTLILEHSKRMDLSELTNFVSKRKYGSSVFSFFEYADLP
ncbi:MAG: methyltransferase domain-containing protein [Eudoraea sp.]|nr:methyltransferase domain-containing protein [Eudoraea sp.]